MERMAARFVNIDHAPPLLLPPDLRDWGSPGHMVHFVMDAVKALDLSLAHTNERGTGHAQYPPSMMLGLLTYCYATAPRSRTASPYPRKSSAAKTASPNSATPKKPWNRAPRNACKQNRPPIRKSSPPARPRTKAAAISRVAKPPNRPKNARAIRTNTISPIPKAAS
jgi:hypothetical protein